MLSIKVCNCTTNQASTHKYMAGAKAQNISFGYDTGGVHHGLQVSMAPIRRVAAHIQPWWQRAIRAIGNLFGQKWFYLG